MSLSKAYSSNYQITPHHQTFSSSPTPRTLSLSSNSTISKQPLTHNAKLLLRNPITTTKVSLSNEEPQSWGVTESKGELEVDLATDGDVYRNTLRLVECSMFAAVSGLAYFLSNSLAIENYFGCFFALPIVISSMRWGVAAGRKTMVATAMLLLTLSGPVKAATYLFMHGLVGLAMGSSWRMGANWCISISLCTFVRALGAVAYVLISSFLIRENILSLITINIHASLTYALTAIGVSTIPSMTSIYVIFGTLLLLNCGFFVFLLHILYAVFFTRLGMKSSLTLPRWLEKAI
ncbi:hypothetical protein GIB67_038560 [Kingdonia uniflora]|uniref:DUF2232 domain-containing protein n=1 Tax=Kingdonia uniflora TaxID=39325 RepID=A0A7J7NPM5_9MAGN|nr:hypothetical protein GIB67_038560 [Kingdonia uniflora]